MIAGTFTALWFYWIFLIIEKVARDKFSARTTLFITFAFTLYAIYNWRFPNPIRVTQADWPQYDIFYASHLTVILCLFIRNILKKHQAEKYGPKP